MALHHKPQHQLENQDLLHASANHRALHQDCRLTTRSRLQLPQGYVAEYLLPYRPQYPSGHSIEYLAPQQVTRLVPSLYRQSYRENQPSLFQYQTIAPLPPYPYVPLYNEKLPDHHRPLNQSYPVPQPRYNASSMAAPSLPLHHKLTSHRVGGTYPLPHQRYVQILP